MLIAIISDTHMPKGSRRLPASCTSRLREAELILHAGDVATLEVLQEIGGLGTPVQAVYGNVDEARLRALLPATLELELGGARIAMIHDAGPASGRLARMRERFPQADAVIFGHSHIPLLESDGDGFQIFNPGSPTERRRAPARTMGIARVGPGSLDFEHVAL